MASKTSTKRRKCSSGASAETVSLPVVGPAPIRKSKSGKRRAAVLILVHLLIAIHIAHWWSTGSTMTPLEPSEAMEFSKHSIVNAGLIFFALMILSTLVLGRWFCGWACHVVALQDLARWILGKMGIRPKSARLGILGLVPLIAFVYMFIAPAVYRLVHGIPAQPVSTHYTTGAIWATFPPWLPAAMTFLTCGFVIIYLLGSKGFCTYGCPYGAIFGIVDQLSPMRIRVTDACQGCGHCTAVCSSNVRVHQEVRDWGMVVDPGCMKCLDCVSVCPNDALYWGFGMPALLAKPRRKEKESKPEGARSSRRWVSWVLMFAFIFASFTVLWWFDTGELAWRLAGWLTAGSFIVALIFKGRSQNVQEYSTAEQVVLGALFLVGLFLFRGLPLGPDKSVPFLFSLGLSAITAYLGLQLLRFVSRPNLALHGWQLKRGGRIAPAGFVFGLVMLGLMGFGVRAGFAQYEEQIKPKMASRYLRRGVELANQNELGRAAEMFERALLWRPSTIEARENLAGMYCSLGRFEEGIAEYRRALEQNPNDASTYAFMAQAYAAMQRYDLAEQHFVRALEISPDWGAAQHMLAVVRAAQRNPLEQQVVSEILSQPLGSHTLEVLGLPDDFVVRVTDRVIRSTYRQNFHQVRGASPVEQAPAQPGVEEPKRDSQTTADSIKIVRSQYPESVRAYRESLTTMMPPLRGFRAAILDQAASRWPMQASDASGPTPVLQAANVVATRLASDGLPATLAMVIDILGAENFADEQTIQKNLEALRAVGLPVDLLSFFSDGPHSGPYGIVPAVARRLTGGASADKLRAELQRSAFKFAPSRADYRVATESGEHDIGLLRVQVPSEKLWRGTGSGDVPDMIGQMVGRLPEASILGSIYEQDLPALLRRSADWNWVDASRFMLLVEPMPLAQWAQDNGKAGVLSDAASQQQRPATLVPRYASQREDGSVAALNDSFLMDGLAASGHVVVQSPLLFQGGNLLAVRDPARSERVLLMGEAEVYRNTALGLTRDQVLEAFRMEFGVDRCVVLPAVSFHIDFDVSLRACDGRLTAFVNDPAAAARIIAGLGLDALESGGLLESSAVQLARAHLQAGRYAEFLDAVHRQVLSQRDGQGYFPARFADLFSTGSGEPGADNLQRFLLALDVLGATAFAPEQVSGNRHQQAYLRSFRRQEADRQAFNRILAEQGWKVVAVPGLAEAEGGISYLNGIHDQRRYFLPVYGGFYAPLDQAAQEAFERELGGVEIVPVPSRASQQRAGALHCSFSAYPKL